MLKEFKAFAMKGNLIDLAVGFVMGAAFTAVTSKFVDGIIMPLVSLVARRDFSTWKFILRPAEKDAAGAVIRPETAILYGDFISAVLYFLIVAFVMFMLVRSINTMKKKKDEAPAPPPPPSRQEELLMEIRDLLKK